MPQRPLRILLIDGVYTHADWPALSEVLRRYLLETGRFSVDTVRAMDPRDLALDFTGYDAVIPYYSPFPDAAGEPLWPEATRRAFEAHLAGGAGAVIVHAASNAFAAWPAYNRMIGVGGWGGRGPESGRAVYIGAAGERRVDEGPGPAGAHEPEHEYVVEHRQPDHPILRGMPVRWLHTEDEVYSMLRGPAEELEILATAFSGKTPQGTQRHEPIVMTIGYGRGRVFHTTLGHSARAVACVGFQALFQRGTEWAASGAVTLPVPSPFPSPERTLRRRLAWPDFALSPERLAAPDGAR